MPDDADEESPVDSDLALAIEELKQLGIVSGAAFNKNELKDLLVEYGKTHNFTIRTENKKFVCSRQGHSNHTSVANIDRLVHQAINQKKKKEEHVDEFATRQEVQEANKHKKPRKSHSDRCGCLWAVGYAKIAGSQKYGQSYLDVPSAHERV